MGLKGKNEITESDRKKVEIMMAYALVKKLHTDGKIDNVEKRYLDKRYKAMLEEKTR